MNSAPADGEGSFFDGLRKRRVSVTGAGEIFAAGTERNRGGGLGNEFTGSRSQNVNAENPIRFFVGEHFHTSVHLAECLGATVRSERERAFLVGNVLFL